MSGGAGDAKSVPGRAKRIAAAVHGLSPLSEAKHFYFYTHKLCKGPSERVLSENLARIDQVNTLINLRARAHKELLKNPCRRLVSSTECVLGGCLLWRSTRANVSARTRHVAGEICAVI